MVIVKSKAILQIPAANWPRRPKWKRMIVSCPAFPSRTWMEAFLPGQPPVLRRLNYTTAMCSREPLISSCALISAWPIRRFLALSAIRCWLEIKGSSYVFLKSTLDPLWKIVGICLGRIWNYSRRCRQLIWVSEQGTSNITSKQYIMLERLYLNAGLGHRLSRNKIRYEFKVPESNFSHHSATSFAGIVLLCTRCTPIPLISFSYIGLTLRLVIIHFWGRKYRWRMCFSLCYGLSRRIQCKPAKS